jgi:hypothetical protein
MKGCERIRCFTSGRAKLLLSRALRAGAARREPRPHGVQGACFVMCVTLAIAGARAEEQAARTAENSPHSLAELAPAAVPAVENAAAHVEALVPLLLRFQDDYTKFYESPAGRAFEQQNDRMNLLTAEQTEAMRPLLEQYPDIDLGLQDAAMCENFASRGDFTESSTGFVEALFERIQRYHSINRYLMWRIRLLTLDGRHDEAARRGIEMLRLSRLHQNEPTILGYLVAADARNTAIQEIVDVLAGRSVSHAVHAALDEELARIDDGNDFTRVLRSERAVALTAEAEVARVQGIDAQVVLRPKAGASGYLSGVIAASASWSAFRLQARDGETWGRPTELGAKADEMAQRVAEGVADFDRDIAVVRSLRVLNALRLFAKVHRREAGGLEDLDLPDDALIDPYSGSPLKVKRTDAGWKVYSVMANGVGDGGEFRDRLDYGVGTPRMRWE